MLILTRKANERIFIGDDVVLVVLGVENNRVKLGIEAPSDITILREEIVNSGKSPESAGKDDAIGSDQDGADNGSLKTGT